jgi:hypothetical protein
MRRLFFWTGLASSVVAACASEAPAPPASTPIPSLVGQYDATSAGEIASINFYDAKQYYLRRSSCPSDDAGCVVHGSYRVDAATSELVLRDDGASADERVRLSVLETEPLAPAAPAEPKTASLHVDFLGFGSSDPPPQPDPKLVNDGPDRLVTPLGCLIMKRVQLGNQSLGMTSIDEGFRTALRRQIVSGQIPLSDPPAWVQQAIDQAKTTCQDPSRIQAGSLTWQGIDLVDIPTCWGADESRLNHAVFTRSNLRTAQFDWTTLYRSVPGYRDPVAYDQALDFQELMSPQAVFSTANAACGLPG